MKRIILPLFCLVLLCGCAGYKEINNGYLITATAFEKSNDNVKITLNAVLPESQDILVLSSSGSSLQSAFENLKKQQTKAFYFEHCGVVVLNENIKADKKEILNFCKQKMDIPISAGVVYCNDITALFNADCTGYDIMSLIKNTEIDTQNRIYKIEQQNTKLPIIALKNGVMYFEGEIE